MGFVWQMPLTNTHDIALQAETASDWCWTWILAQYLAPTDHASERADVDQIEPHIARALVPDIAPVDECPSKIARKSGIGKGARENLHGSLEQAGNKQLLRETNIAGQFEHANAGRNPVAGVGR